MACPFFMPTEKFENGAWPHPARLPLGAGWRGHCTAPGHEGEVPTDAVLEQSCNLGYGSCGLFPQLQDARPCDAIRFSAVPKAITKESSPQDFAHSADYVLRVRYVREQAHRPADDGWLDFDPLTRTWLQPHPDPRVQRMAECFLESYLQKREKNR